MKKSIVIALAILVSGAVFALKPATESVPKGSVTVEELAASPAS